MSSVNYSLNHKGVRLIDAKDAWVVGKNKKVKLNPKYHFIGKMDMKMTNMLMSASDKNKPKYKGDVNNLNNTAKSQIIEHFFDNKGKRNKKTVAYFGIEKKTTK